MSNYINETKLVMDICEVIRKNVCEQVHGYKKRDFVMRMIYSDKDIIAFAAAIGEKVDMKVEG